MDRETARRIIKTRPLDAEYIARRLVDGVFEWTEQYQSRAHAAIDCLARTAGYVPVYYRCGEFAILELPGLEPVNDTLLGFGTPPPEFGTFDPRAEVEEAVEDASVTGDLSFVDKVTFNVAELGEGPARELRIVYWPAETVHSRAETVLEALEIPSLRLLRGLWYADFMGAFNDLVFTDHTFVPIRRAHAAHPLEQRNLTELAAVYGITISHMRRLRRTEITGFAKASSPRETLERRDTILALAECHGLKEPLFFHGPVASLEDDELALVSPLRSALELIRWRRASHLIIPAQCDLPDVTSEREEMAAVLEEALVPLVTAEGVVAPDEVRAYLLGESEATGSAM